MRESLAKAVIVGLVWVLAGCSALRLGYDQGPLLAWWWLDGYVDFSGEQVPRAKEAIREWFDWHRTTQLREYAAWLGTLRAKTGDSITPAQVCRWNDEVRQKLAPALDRALVTGAPLVRGLGEAQLKHLEQRYQKNLTEHRSEHLQPDRDERLASALKRTVERAESVYGPLTESQRTLIATALEAAPYDPEGQLADRRRRQQDILRTLRALVAERADQERVVAALRGLAERFGHSPDPAYRRFQQRVLEFNCGLIARIHNATTREQRQAARDKLGGWEADLRALTAVAPS